MKSLSIFGGKPLTALSSSPVFLTLQEILEVIVVSARDTHWRIGDFIDEDGIEWFEFAGEDWSQRKFAQEGVRLPTRELVAMASTMPQAIWASFSGFRPSDAPSPWIVLNAIDGHLWRIDTDELGVRRVVRTSFADVRESEE